MDTSFWKPNACPPVRFSAEMPNGQGTGEMNQMQRPPEIFERFMPHSGNSPRSWYNLRNLSSLPAHSENIYTVLCSVMLLIIAMLLVGVSTWGGIVRMPYFYLANHAAYLGISSFAVAAGILCISCSRLALTKFYSGSRVHVSLLTIFLCVAVTILVTACCIGVSYSTRVSFDWIPSNTTVKDHNLQPNFEFGVGLRPILSEGIYRVSLNGSMTASLYAYDAKSFARWAWDQTQSDLRCCGVHGSQDWVRTRGKVPLTCCEDSLHDFALKCTKGVHSVGCLDLIAYDLSTEIYKITGIGFIAILINLATLIVHIP